MRNPLSNLLLILAVFTALLFSGCQNRPLAPDGVYAGNEYAFKADVTIQTAAKALKTFLRIEKANRATLGADVQKLAAKLRIEAPRKFQLAEKAVQIYRDQPTPEGKDEVQYYMDFANDILREVQVILAQVDTQKPPTN
jgi:hypothetical protein